MVRTVKTKEELEEDLNRSIIEAKAQYDNVVKPTQEAYRAAERKVREILETNNSLMYTATPMIATPMMYDTREQYENDYERDQYQKVIDADEDAYRKIVKNAMSDFLLDRIPFIIFCSSKGILIRIEKPAKAEKDAAIRLANKQYDEALEELRKVDDWFEYRRTYQRSLRPISRTELEPCTHEETKIIKKVVKRIEGKDKLKCHFCGNSKARTEAGLNKVKYRLKHPGAGFWSTLLGRNWKYACQDCADYIVHMWGHAEMKPVEGKDA